MGNAVKDPAYELFAQKLHQLMNWAGYPRKRRPQFIVDHFGGELSRTAASNWLSANSMPHPDNFKQLKTFIEHCISRTGEVVDANEVLYWLQRPTVACPFGASTPIASYNRSDVTKEQQQLYDSALLLECYAAIGDVGKALGIPVGRISLYQFRKLTDLVLAQATATNSIPTDFIKELLEIAVSTEPTSTQVANNVSATELKLVTGNN